MGSEFFVNISNELIIVSKKNVQIRLLESINTAAAFHHYFTDTIIQYQSKVWTYLLMQFFFKSEISILPIDTEDIKYISDIYFIYKKEKHLQSLEICFFNERCLF